MQCLKSKKTLILAIVIVIAVTGGIVGLIFNAQKLPTYKLLIKPTELLPFVSHEQARAKICNTMKGQLFDKICQQKFDRVGKNDAEKIGTLFSLLKKIGNDRSISDYDKSLLSQAIFASLPTKDSPLTRHQESSVLLTKFKNFTSKKSIAYAQEPNNNLGMGVEEFKKMMLGDLKEVVSDDLPGEDNAWVINIMVSKYKWVNGERQPIYSEQYSETYDPYSDVIDPNTGEELEGKGKYEKYLSTHVRSRTSAYATNQAMFNGHVKEGSGEMIAYSYILVSWHSRPYGVNSTLTLAEAGPGERYNKSIRHFTEENYNSDDLLSNLLANAKMPSHERPDKDLQKDVKSLEKTTKTSWGGTEDQESAYEQYFWIHLQRPEKFPTFWDAYNDTGAIGGLLHSLPIGEPVDLRAYFDTSGVKEYYEDMRKGGMEVPPLDDFLDNIDEYQANLGLPKP